ncbi:MAG: hypothetical protein H0W93_03110 [Gammaproteobacteria bacterium]|nr:hypothetical protein [Gammaproteobacteria bacterium]
MRSTRKGKQWYFGMQWHISADLRGTVHRVTATDRPQADIHQLPELLHGDETPLYGDRA